MKTSYLATQQTQHARRYPLINYAFQAVIELPNTSLELQGKQISDTELRLEASPTQVHLLVPRQALSRPGILLNYFCKLSLDNLELLLKTEVLRSRRTSQTKFEVVLKLVDLSLEQKQQLEQYLQAIN